MFNTAGIFFRDFQIDTGFHKPCGKKTMPLVNFFCDLAPLFCQMEKVIFVHNKEAALLQDCYSMTYAGLGYSKMPGHVHGTHHTHFLMEYKNGFQIILPGRIEFHKSPLY